MKKMGRRLPQPVCLHGWRVRRLWRVCCRNCLRPGPSLTYSAPPGEFESFIVVTILMAIRWSLFPNSNVDILWFWFTTREITLIYSWDVFSKRGEGIGMRTHANIIRQICAMFSALPLTFCPLPPITHSQAKAADLGNGLPPSSPACLWSCWCWCLLWDWHLIRLLNLCRFMCRWFGVENFKTRFSKHIISKL